MVTLTVNGMTCKGCAASVERAVAALGATATVTLETHTVEVVGSVDREALVKAIEAAGFDVAA